jgi:hypothetical protein
MNLVRALVDLCVFLEYSDDNVLDPNAALKAFEDLSVTLQSADPSVQRSVRAEISKLAATYDAEKSSFVESLADNIGLCDDE